jgi:hypothetical protein
MCRTGVRASSPNYRKSYMPKCVNTRGGSGHHKFKQIILAHLKYLATTNSCSSFSNQTYLPYHELNIIPCCQDTHTHTFILERRLCSCKWSFWRYRRTCPPSHFHLFIMQPELPAASIQAMTLPAPTPAAPFVLRHIIHSLMAQDMPVDHLLADASTQKHSRSSEGNVSSFRSLMPHLET